MSLLDEAFRSCSLFCETITSCSWNNIITAATTPVVCNSNELGVFLRIVRLLFEPGRLDPTLKEETDRAGCQSACALLLKQIDECRDAIVLIGVKEDDEDNAISEEDSDALVELQDAVYEVYSPSSSWARSMAFEEEELRRRLPLAYDPSTVPSAPSSSSGDDDDESDDDATIFIHQVTKRQSAQSDVGFVMWPSAIVLSRWIASNPRVLDGGNKSVLELGAGCGLVGIAAARILMARRRRERRREEETATDHPPPSRRDEDEEEGEVILSDVNELVLKNLERNIRLNDAESVASVAKLDFYAQSGRDEGTWLAGERTDDDEEGETATDSSSSTSRRLQREPVHVILAADIICQPSDAVAASKTINDALRPDGVAYVVCATAHHRYGVEIFEGECERRGLRVVAARDVAGMEGAEGLLMGCEMRTAAGYVEGMELTFFEIRKRLRF